MTLYIKKIFIDNWFRKIISLFVAIVIWFVVHDSLMRPNSNPTSNLDKVENIR